MLLLRVVKLVLVIMCSMLLLQGIKVTDPVADQKVKGLPSPFNMPATAYLELAKNQAVDEKQSLYILAAGRLIYEGHWQEGLKVLMLTGELSPPLESEKKLLLAKVDLIREQPRLVINKLSSIHDLHELPIYFQAQFHEMLAEAYYSLGNALESVSERIKLDKLLPDESSKANNRRALWLSLTLLPAPELEMLSVETKGNSVLKGWIELARISRHHDTSKQTMLEDIREWQYEFEQHPANAILPSPIESVFPYLYNAPKKLALLLPLTGPIGGPGSAIKDGFFAAHHASPDAEAVKIRVYNTEGVDVGALYQQALAEGAEFVVGPLSKPNVALIAASNHPVPTLLLNDTSIRPREGAYLFGLSPTNEARQVAAKARKNGYSRALIIAPEGAWSDDVTSAFSQQWQTSGGLVVDALHYRPNDDMNQRIRDFLRISASEARGRQLRQFLGQKIESTPSRRKDFDMIFLLAYPSKARQIMPLLHYYYAGDVPVYSTSLVYAGSINVMKDKDLDGIIFCDMPWVFTHQTESKNWPEQLNSYNRLYALGMDAYALTTQLNRLIIFPAMGISDKSGVLYLNPSQQISRRLAWGQFKQGVVEEIREK